LDFKEFIRMSGGESLDKRSYYANLEAAVCVFHKEESMTPQEREMLAELAEKIGKTPVPAHDPEADEFIRTNIGKRPDALYILTQTTLIQNLAIQHAQQEIQELKQRLAQPAAVQPPSSFLGPGAPPAPSRPASVTPSWSAPSPAPPPIPQNAPPAPAAPSFLRSAAQTAAGVAAGALAFEGIRSLFGGGGSGGWGGPHLGGTGGDSFLAGAPGGETIINNYYDTPDVRDRDVSERSDPDDRSSDSNDADVSAASNDADTSYDDTSDTDDSSSADTSYDDGGGSGDDNFV
jgi:hypothetical protein